MSYMLSFLRTILQFFILEGSLVLFPCRQLVIMHCLYSVTHFPKLCHVSFGKHRAVSGISVWSPCWSAGFYPELLLKAFMSFKRRRVLHWLVSRHRGDAYLPVSPIVFLPF